MIVVPLALLIAMLVRARIWFRKPCSRALTVALGALAVAITLRIPSVGDDWIDPRGYDLLHIANISELVAHVFVLAAGLAFLQMA